MIYNNQYAENVEQKYQHTNLQTKVLREGKQFSNAFSVAFETKDHGPLIVRYVISCSKYISFSWLTLLK